MNLLYQCYWVMARSHLRSRRCELIGAASLPTVRATGEGYHEV